MQYKTVCHRCCLENCCTQFNVNVYCHLNNSAKKLAIAVLCVYKFKTKQKSLFVARNSFTAKYGHGYGYTKYIVNKMDRVAQYFCIDLTPYTNTQIQFPIFQSLCRQDFRHEYKLNRKIYPFWLEINNTCSSKGKQIHSVTKAHHCVINLLTNMLRNALINANT